jgi:hypothetical protein
MPVGDIHWGSMAFPLKHFKRSIEWAVDRGMNFIGMGDYLEFASDTQRVIMQGLRDSVRSDLHNGVKAKADGLLEVLAPTVGRWVGLLRGNHTWVFDDGTSIEQYLAKYLQTDFLGDSALIRLRATDAPVNHPEADTVVFLHHGKGGGQSVGGQLNALEKTLKWMEADIVLMGHSHGKIAGGVDKLYLTPDGKLCSKESLVARTGAFLRGYAGKEPLPNTEPSLKSEGSYVEKGLFMPSCMGAICFSIGYEQIDNSKFYKPTIHYSV